MAQSTSGASAPGYRLNNRIAVVTGAAVGIGRAIVDRLVEFGARVALLDLQSVQPDLATLAGGLGTRCLAVGCDIAEEGSVEAAAASVDGGFLETPLMHAQPPTDQYGGFDG